MRTLKNLIIDNFEFNVGFSQSINRALKVLQFTIHTRTKINPLELRRDREPMTELSNTVKVNKSCLSDWTKVNISVTPKQIEIFVARNEKGEVMDHILIARKKRIPWCSGRRLPMKKPVMPVSGRLKHAYAILKTNPEEISRMWVLRLTKNCYRRYQTHGLNCR